MWEEGEERPTWCSTAKALAFVVVVGLVGFVLAHYMFLVGFRPD